MAQRDHGVTGIEFLKRELAVVRARLLRVPPHHRPDCTPAERFEILQIRDLRGWNAAVTAEYFVLHSNTIRSWKKVLAGTGRAGLLAGAVVWNRIDDGVRHAIHQLRALCPEPEFGTRTIAPHLLRAGIKLSRSSVQRTLREPLPERPKPPKPPMEEPARKQPDNLPTPEHANHVHHMDMVQISLLGMFHFIVAVILDGYSRKILAAKVYRRTPCSRNLAALVRSAAAKHGKPKFLITDHGCQFRKQFHASITKAGIKHVRGKVRAPYLNGKIERSFRTLRIWWRTMLCGSSTAAVQRRIDDYVFWYKEHRPHSALGVLTPDEACSGNNRLPEPIPIRARDPQKFNIQVARQKCRGDPRLPVIQIAVRKAA